MSAHETQTITLEYKLQQLQGSEFSTPEMDSHIDAYFKESVPLPEEVLKEIPRLFFLLEDWEMWKTTDVRSWNR